MKKEITTAGYIFTGLQIFILIAGMYQLRNPALSIFNQDMDSWIKFIAFVVIVLIVSFILEPILKKLGIELDQDSS